MNSEAPNLFSPRFSLPHLALCEYGISLYTQDCIGKVHFSRSNYQRSCRDSENGKISPTSPLIQKLAQLFQQFSLLPEIWTNAQMQDALAHRSPIIDELHTRFTNIQSSIAVLDKNHSSGGKLRDYLCPHFAHCFDHMVCSLPKGANESLFSRFFFGEASSLLIMNNSISYKQIHNHFYLLVEHVAEVINSPECIKAKELTSKIWLDWFIRKPGPLTSDKRSFERMGIAMAIMRAKRYDIVLTGCDGGNNLLGLLAWARKNLSVYLHITLIASNDESRNRHKLLFYFIKDKHRFLNLELDIIIGDLDDHAAWLKVAHISYAGHRVFMGVENNRDLSLGESISASPNRGSHLAFTALYLKSSDLPSLAFWPTLLCDNFVQRAERIRVSWTRYNFQPVTAILEESMSAKCVSATFVFGNRVDSAHRDLISQIMRPTLAPVPSKSEVNQDGFDVAPSVSAPHKDKKVGWISSIDPYDRLAKSNRSSADETQ